MEYTSYDEKGQDNFMSFELKLTKTCLIVNRDEGTVNIVPSLSLAKW